MSLVDDLLKADAGKLLEKPAAKFEVKRLSKLLKTKFDLILQSVSPRRYAEIQREAIELGKTGTVRDIDIYSRQMLTLLAGIKEPALNDKKLLEHFSAATPKELAAKLFLPGEIQDITDKIDELSGYEKEDLDGADEKIKNLSKLTEKQD